MSNSVHVANDGHKKCGRKDPGAFSNPWKNGQAGIPAPHGSFRTEAITLGYISANCSTYSSFSMTSGVDNFNATGDYEAIPDPGTLALLGAAGLVIGVIRRCTGC